MADAGGGAVSKGAQQRLAYKHSTWDIGTYFGAGSVCVNLHFDGKTYHRHDYIGIFPRWIRIGWYVRSIERESGIREWTKRYVEQRPINE